MHVKLCFDEVLSLNTSYDIPQFIILNPTEAESLSGMCGSLPDPPSR